MIVVDHGFNNSNSILSKLNFQRTVFDGVYVRKKNNEIDAVLLIWVDDILVCSGLTKAINVLNELSKYMEIEIKGTPTRFVGIDIKVHDKYIDINQFVYNSLFNVRDFESFTEKCIK